MGGKGRKAPGSSPSPLPVAEKEKSGSEIDAIFGQKKRKKPPAEIDGGGNGTDKTGRKRDCSGEGKVRDGEAQLNGTVGTRRKMKAKDSSSKATPLKSPSGPSKPRKKTEDGFTIYREADLGLDKKDAGGTPLCPFDCDCCF